MNDVQPILDTLGVRIEYATSTDYVCYCPFHDNADTPAMTVSIEEGLYRCWNAACAATGNLEQMVQKLTNRTRFEAMRFIATTRESPEENVGEEIERMFEERRRWEAWPTAKIDTMVDEFWSSERAQAYIRGRGFTKETAKLFQVGYSSLRDMVTVPLHTHDGTLVGVVGRGIEEKKFKYSKGLPKNWMLFNLNRARKVGGRVVVVEATFDAMRVHQAGIPSVVATLGGSFSDYQADLLRRYFQEVVIMTDADEAGRKLGKDIERKLSDRFVLWAGGVYNEDWPEGAKDAGDLTDQQIQNLITNAKLGVQLEEK